MKHNWLDSFLGKGTSITECEGLMLTIPKELVAAELPLYATKWFDYKRLHPVQATYYFAHCYSVAYRRAYATTRDYETSKTIKPLRVDDAFKSSDINALWKARQSCDAIGATYNFYTAHALELTSRYGWKFIPRPNQIYTDAMIDEVAAAWETRCTDILQIVGDTSQYGTEELSEWYMGQIKKRPSPAFTASKLIKMGILTVEQITQGLSESVAMKAIRLTSL